MPTISFRPITIDDCSTYFVSLQDTIKSFFAEYEYTSKSLKNIISKMKQWWAEVYCAIDASRDEIVWLWTLQIEYSYLRWWVAQWHLGYLVVRKWCEWQWIGTKLIQHLIDYAKSSWCYKVTLECNETLIPFYKKQWFAQKEVSMKMYL